MKAFSKDIRRTIRGSKKRYLSIVAICALGATMLTGLSIACLDLRDAAEALYNRQHLFDISVQSTLGLTQDDVDELSQVDGVSHAEGGYEIETYTEVDGTRATVMLKSLLDSGMNAPYVVEGELPDAPNEIAVTENYLHATHKAIGDTVTFEDAIADDPTGLSDLDTSVDAGDEATGSMDGAQDEADKAEDTASDVQDDASDTQSDAGSTQNADEDADDPLIPGGTYTIVGTVIDPTNITQPEGPVAFRASTSSDYTFFVSRDAVADTSSYTVVYLAVSGTEGLSSYSDAYKARVDEVQSRVEDLAPQRERARTESIKNDALDEIAASEADANEQLADAERELDDGQATIDESLSDALAGQRELDTQRASALTELDDAQATIDAQRATLTSGAASLAAGQQELAANVQAFNAALPAAEQKLRDGQAQLDAAHDTFYQETLPGLEAKRDEMQQGIDQLTPAVAQLDGSAEQLAQGLSALAAAPEVAAIPGMADQLNAQAAQLTSAWEAIQAADASDEKAAAAAVSAYAEAAMDAANTLSTFTPTIDDKLAGIAQQINTTNEQVATFDEKLQGYDASIAQLQTDLAALEEQLSGLAEDDPTRAELEAQRDELNAQLAQTQTKQQGLQAQRDAAAQAVEQLQEQHSTWSGYRASIQSIIDFADPANERNASAVAQARVTYGSQLAQAQAALPQLTSAISTAKEQAEAEFATQQRAIDNGWDALWNGYDQLIAAQKVLDQNARTIASGMAQLKAGQAELDAQRTAALAQLDDAQQQINDGLAQLADAQAELDEGRATFEQERADAKQQIADARAQAAEVEDATWYVQDRSALGSFSSVDSDASSIEAIARIIPVIFFVVAILVSLTTATRMVEEERGLIGLYKALGYSNTRILSKYLIYTASAALVGGIIGDIAGFVGIPYVLFYIFQAMYLLPLFSLHFDLFYAVLGIAAFVIGIAGSTFVTCRNDLRESPASLMRPRAPRAGSRIFLEHIRPLWRRMSFLNKVTARNLFRYKKRLTMTIFGIMGCTALLICGFAIKNTVESLAPRQYEQIYRYDLMAVTSADDYEDARGVLEDSGEVTDLEPIGVDNITVEHEGAKESMQLYVIPRGSSISDYVSLQELDGTPIDLDQAGVVMTNNAATVLGLDAGNQAEVTTSALDKATVPVAAVTRNYLGNAVYMTEDAYEDLFGSLELNGFYAHLTGSDTTQRAFADELEGDDLFMSVTSVAKMREQFEQSFTLINVVVYVVIGLAAGLAFVVLFTLSTVNIGEREREIATIKVLGFRPREVRTYINKETLVLTGLGILVGLPAGWALSESFTYILKMPSIYFDVVVDPWCYALAAAFSIVFALAVSLITNRMLTRINMVEALKSPE